jgi:hypothetical protein
MEAFLWKYHREKLAAICFGHTEEFTEEMAGEYAAWCLSDEGKQYLKGGSEYDPNHRGNKASAKARAAEG